MFSSAFDFGWLSAHRPICAVLPILLSIIWSQTVSAADFDYNWVGAHYQYTELDVPGTSRAPNGETLDGNGYMIDVSWGFADHVHAFGRYNDSDLNAGTSLAYYELGFGLNFSPIPNTLDALVQAAYINTEFEAPWDPSLGFGRQIYRGDDDGFSLRAGVRWALFDSLEIDGGLVYLDISNVDQSGAYVDIFWHFSDRFSLRLGVDSVDDLTQAWAGLRWAVGQRSH